MAKTASQTTSPGTVDEAAREPKHPLLPTEWQCALLILRLIEAREDEFRKQGLERKVSRARLSQNTIRKLCGRSQIPQDFLLEVQEYLLMAGWALFSIGPTHYAIIRLELVQGWSRISSKRIAKDLAGVRRGTFIWGAYEKLLTAAQDAGDEDTGDDVSEGEEPEF